MIVDNTACATGDDLRASGWKELVLVVWFSNRLFQLMLGAVGCRLLLTWGRLLLYKMVPTSMFYPLVL
jgi:hypothetical protein